MSEAARKRRLRARHAEGLKFVGFWINDVEAAQALVAAGVLHPFAEVDWPAVKVLLTEHARLVVGEDVPRDNAADRTVALIRHDPNARP